MTVWVYQSPSDDRSTLLGVPELVKNSKMDEVRSVGVCQARLSGLDPCAVSPVMTVPGSSVYLGVPVGIYNREGDI